MPPRRRPWLAISPRERDAILAGLRRATDLAPENALYWRSRGEFLLGRGALNEGSAKYLSAAAYDEGLDAFRRALALQPRDTALWFHFYFILRARPTPGGWSDHDPAQDTAEALAAIRTVCERDSGNAFVQYHLASLLIADGVARAEKAGQEEGLDAPEAMEALAVIRAANANPRCQAIGYTPSVPPYLSVAWQYWGWEEDILQYWSFAFSHLARQTGSLALTEARRGNPAAAVEALRAVLGISQNLARSVPADVREWDPGDLQGWDLREWGIADAAAEIGRATYDALVRVYRQTGDREGELAILSEGKAAKALYWQRIQAYDTETKYRYRRY
jgi:hypothetical protein